MTPAELLTDAFERVLHTATRAVDGLTDEQLVARPTRDANTIAWCLAGAGRPVVDVLDLGAGTGALTAGLVAAGLSVTAVEPDPEMLTELRRRLPDVPAAVGRAEAVPLPDGSVDAVLVGTAFHWFDTGRALSEITRVLRPDGVLGVLYNLSLIHISEPTRPY